MQGFDFTYHGSNYCALQIHLGGDMRGNYSDLVAEDYAIYELRAEQLINIGHYHEALDNAFRLYLLYHEGSYAAYQGTLKARIAAEKLGYPIAVYSAVERQVLGRVFELDENQQKLFEAAIATGRREKEKAAPAQ